MGTASRGPTAPIAASTRPVHFRANIRTSHGVMARAVTTAALEASSHNKHLKVLDRIHELGVDVAARARVRGLREDHI